MSNEEVSTSAFPHKPYAKMTKKELKRLPVKLGDKRSVEWRKQFDIGEIVALVKKGLNFSEISRVLGCSRQNVVKRFRKVEQEINAGKRYQEYRSDIFAIHQSKILNSITEDDLERASLRDKVISVGVLFDKEKAETDKTKGKGITIEIINFAGACGTGEGKVGQIVRVSQEKMEEAIDIEE